MAAVLRRRCEDCRCRAGARRLRGTGEAPVAGRQFSVGGARTAAALAERAGARWVSSALRNTEAEAE